MPHILVKNFHSLVFLLIRWRETKKFDKSDIPSNFHDSLSKKFTRFLSLIISLHSLSHSLNTNQIIKTQSAQRKRKKGFGGKIIKERSALALPTQDCQSNFKLPVKKQSFSLRIQYTLEPVVFGFNNLVYKTNKESKFFTESLFFKTFWFKMQTTCPSPLSFFQLNSQQKPTTTPKTKRVQVPNHFWPESSSLVNLIKETRLPYIILHFLLSKLAVKSSMDG